MKHIDNLFKDELGNFADAPPPMVWDALEKRLEERKRRAFPYQWFWLSAITIIVFAGASIAWNMADGKASSIAHVGNAKPASGKIVASEVGVSTAKMKNIENEEQKASSNHIPLANANDNSDEAVKEPETITSQKTRTRIKKNAKIAVMKELTEEVDDKDEYGNTTSGNQTLSGEYNEEEDPYYAATASTSDEAQYSGSREMMIVESEGHVVKGTSKRRSEERAVSAAAHKTNEQSAIADRNEVALKKTRQPKAATNQIASAKTTAQIGVKTQKYTQPLNTLSASSVASANHSVKPANAKPGAIAPKVVKDAKASRVAKQTRPLQMTSPVEAKKPSVGEQQQSDVKAMPVATTTKAEKAINNPLSEKESGKKTAAPQGKNLEIKLTKVVTTAKDVPARRVTTGTDTKVSVIKKQKPVIAAEQPTVKKPAAQKQLNYPAQTVSSMPLSASMSKGSKTESASASEKLIEKVEKAAKTEARQSEKKAGGNAKAIAGNVTKATETNNETTLANAKVVAVAEKGRDVKQKEKAGNQKQFAVATASEIGNKAAASKSSLSSYVTARSAGAGANTKMLKPYRFYDDSDVEEILAASAVIVPAAVVADAAKEELPRTFKQEKNEVPAPVATAEKQFDEVKDSAIVPGMKVNRWEIGIKAGFEGSATTQAARKGVVSPYISFRLTSKLSLMTQPSFKVSNVKERALDGTQSFYKAHDDGKYTLVDSELTYVVFVGPMWKRNYSYSQTYDSIAKSYSVGGTYFEAELPLMLKYDVTPKFSVYGGANAVFGKSVGVHENTYNSGPILKTANKMTMAPTHQSAPTPPPVNAVITYSGVPLSSYNGPLYPSPEENVLRLGYMFGFSYEYKKRWLFDALVQQGFTKSNVQGGYNLNTALSLPYVRLTLGYRLIK